jgi:dCTP deaminase
MGILSDHELWGLITAGRLKIDPTPAADAISPSTIDLSLGDKFTVLAARGGPAVETVIDTRDSSAVLQALSDFGTEIEIAADGYFELRPGMFVLGWTRESISLPNYLAARIEGRSTLARLGLSIHQTAPTVHPTFDAPLRLELSNVGPFTLKLYPGQAICQLVVETMSLPAATSLQSIHQHQTP